MKKKIYFFVHVPKTAGTSFRKALEENDQISMLYDYGEDNHESHAGLVAGESSEVNPDNDIFHKDKFNIISGHVGFRKYAHCVSEDAILSIIRNPIERIVSEYQHLKRHAGLKISFSDFCATPVQTNKQLKMLSGLGGKSDAVIGLTSHYKFFLDVCSGVMGLPIRTIGMNCAPVADVESRFAISADDINMAFEHNIKDIKFYFAKARFFAKKVEGAGYNTKPNPDIKWNCRIDSGKRLIGWMPRGKMDCYFLELAVNGEKRAIIGLDQERPDIFDKRLSEDSICGFNYPLPLLGVRAGDTLQVSVLGMPKVSRAILIETSN